MSHIANPPIREAPPMSNLESDKARFKPQWERWFADTGRQVVDNTTAISNLSTDIISIQTLLQAIFHVGCIFETSNSADPATYFGFGTWNLYGVGRTTICLDVADPSFDTIEETGGSKIAIIGSHTHSLSAHTHTHSAHTHGLDISLGGGTDLDAGVSPTISKSYTGSTASDGSGTTSGPSADVTGSSGGSTQSVLNPYIVVYRWQRVA